MTKTKEDPDLARKSLTNWEPSSLSPWTSEEHQEFNRALKVLKTRAGSGEEEAIKALGWDMESALSGEGIILNNLPQGKDIKLEDKGKWFGKRMAELSEEELSSLQFITSGKNKGWLRPFQTALANRIETTIGSKSESVVEPIIVDNQPSNISTIRDINESNKARGSGEVKASPGSKLATVS